MIYIRLFEDRDKYDNSTLYYPSVSCIKNENSKIMYDVFKSNTPTIIAKYVLVEDVPQGESAFYTIQLGGVCSYVENFVRDFDSFKVNGVETVESTPIEDLGTYTPIATEIDENMDGPLFTPESLITGASALHITFSKKPELIGLYIDGMGNVVGDFDMWADVAALTVISDTEYLINISTISDLIGVDYESLITTAYGSDGSMTINDINSFNTSIKASVGGNSSNGNDKGWKAGEYEVVMVPSKICNLVSLFEDIDSLKELYLYGDFSNINLTSFVNNTNISKIKFHNTRIKTIANEMFSYCYDLQNINIPSSVTSIDDYAFEHCNNLNKITIPDSVTSIGDCAFYYCHSLTSVTIPNSVTSIREYAFKDCYGLIEVVIGDSVTSIGDRSFEGCSALTSLGIPNSVESIGDYAFNKCLFQRDKFINNSNLTSSDNWGAILCDIIQNDGLAIDGTTAVDCRTNATSVIIPDSVTSIGYHAFEDCDSLTSVTIGNGVTSIGNYAFKSCYGLTSVIIGNGVTSIGDYAFQHCHSLSEITIPDGVTSIGDWVFSSCYDLTSVTIPDGVTSIGSDAFSYCNSLTKITIPDGVTSIGSHAFRYCNSLSEITIPDGVTSIGSHAFQNCNSLSEITIPDSMTSIGDYTFYGCSNLTEITCLATTAPSLGSYVFNNLPSNGVLKVPNGSNYSTWLSNLPSGWTIQYI